MSALRERPAQVDRLTLATAARIYREAARHRSRTWLYAIQAGHSGPIKLGLAKNPAERLKTLQTANADTLRPLGAWAVFADEEKLLHAEFDHARLRGEWFRPEPELLETIRALAAYWDWDAA